MKLHQRLLSRTMVERPWWCWLLEFTNQLLFFSLPYIFPWKIIATTIVETFYNNDGNYDYFSFYRTSLFIFSSFPWLIASTFYFILYYYQFPFFEKYRLQEWVWNRGDDQRTIHYLELLKKTFLTLIVGTFGTNFVLIHTLFAYVYGTEQSTFIDMTNNLPSFWVNFYQIMGSLLLFDTGFYWTHRLFHEREWSKKYFFGINLYAFHKDHHAFYSTSALAGTWLHPLDSFITSIACGFIPLYFFRMHLVTYFMYSCINICHSCYDHAGYHLPFDPFQLIPFGSHNDSHNGHHAMNKDNYGLYFRHWDVLCNTDTEWETFEDQREVAFDLYHNLLKTLPTIITKSSTTTTKTIIPSQSTSPSSTPPSQSTTIASQQPIQQQQQQQQQKSVPTPSIIIPIASGHGIHNDINYRYIVTTQNQLILYYGLVIINDGVPLLSHVVEQQAMESGDDNLMSTLGLLKSK